MLYSPAPYQLSRPSGNSFGPSYQLTSFGGGNSNNAGHFGDPNNACGPYPGDPRSYQSSRNDSSSMSLGGGPPALSSSPSTTPSSTSSTQRSLPPMFPQTSASSPPGSTNSSPQDSRHTHPRIRDLVGPSSSSQLSQHTAQYSNGLGSGILPALQFGTRNSNGNEQGQSQAHGGQNGHHVTLPSLSFGVGVGDVGA